MLYHYQASRLRDGLTVATVEMPYMTSVSLGLWVGSGGRFEPAPVSGISHFIEHMLFKGTARRSAKEISQAVEGIGGYLNAFTTEENTCYFSKARRDRFDELLAVLSDMFLNSRFAPEDIDKERDVIKEELAMYQDQPQHHVQELLNETLWPDQPLGRSLTGSVPTLDHLTRAALLSYQKSHYVAPAIVVAAAGNLRHKQVVTAVSRFARHVPAGKRPRFAPAWTDQDRVRVRLHTKKIEQTQIALGIRCCSRHDDRRFALRVLNAILGENMSSRLFQDIREDRGLAYSVHSALSFFDDVGALVISAGLDSDNLPEVLKLILRQLRLLADKGPSANEIRRARDYLTGQIDLGLENTETQMIWMGEHLLGYHRVFCPDTYKQRLNEVRSLEVRQAARDYFRPDRFNLALVSPLKSRASIDKLLQL